MGVANICPQLSPPYWIYIWPIISIFDIQWNWSLQNFKKLDKFQAWNYQPNIFSMAWPHFIPDSSYIFQLFMMFFWGPPDQKLLEACNYNFFFLNWSCMVTLVPTPFVPFERDWFACTDICLISRVIFGASHYQFWQFLLIFL